MARGYTAEYIQWLEDNNFSPEDEKLILKTATVRMVIWLILSCIPTVNIFILPLLMNAWTYRKIIKQKSFEPRPGLLYSLFSLAMYITFILIIPWILWTVVKKGRWGCGIRGLIRKGKIGNGNRAYSTGNSTAESSYAAAAPSQKRAFPWFALLLIIVVILAAIVVFRLFIQDKPQEGGQNSVLVENYIGLSADDVTDRLELSGIRYSITYVESSHHAPGTIIGQIPEAGTVSNGFDHIEITVVKDNDVMPDFNGLTSEQEILDLAEEYRITVQMTFTDGKSDALWGCLPDGMVIDRIETDPAPGSPITEGTIVTVTIYVRPMYDITGDWYHAEYMYGSLSLTQYSFREDGTFRYYYMGYVPVDYETEVYTYGTYWAGAMGADSFEGTYQVSGSQLALSYDFWNWETESNDHANRTMDFTLYDGVLTLGYAEYGIYTDYLPGTQPDQDEPIPFSINGSWYAFGTPKDNEFGDQILPVYTFYLFSNGEFKAIHYTFMNSGDGWYFPGAGSVFVGTYNFDNSELALSYTAKLRDNYNNNGDIISTESLPVDYYHTIMMNVVNGTVTDAASYTLSLNNFYQYDPSPYANMEMMDTMLDHANELYP